VSRHHERPTKRVNPSGRVVWVARYTDRHGNRPSAGTFPVKGPCKIDPPTGVCCAQHAIWMAYERDRSLPTSGEVTVGRYAETWLNGYPRSPRTNTNYEQRLRTVLDVAVEGRALRDWPMGEVRRRQINALVDHMLKVQGRARQGAVGILRVLSAMWADAATDEYVDGNPFYGLRIKASDPRIRKAPIESRVFSWKDMHAFAAAAAGVRTGKGGPSDMDRWRAVYAEAMVRVLSDAGLRLGELLALEHGDVRPAGACDLPECRIDVPHLHVLRTAHEGMTQPGTKTDHGQPGAGRAAPLGPALEARIRALPRRLDTRLLFPTPRGLVWRAGLFYREVWGPAQEAVGLDCRPHEFRHSWVTLLRAAGINPDELAKAAGHTVATQHARYTHPQGLVYDAINRAVGDGDA
jgi:integrase